MKICLWQNPVWVSKNRDNHARRRIRIADSVRKFKQDKTTWPWKHLSILRSSSAWFMNSVTHAPRHVIRAFENLSTYCSWYPAVDRCEDFGQMKGRSANAAERCCPHGAGRTSRSWFQPTQKNENVVCGADERWWTDEVSVAAAECCRNTTPPCNILTHVSAIMCFPCVFSMLQFQHCSS